MGLQDEWGHCTPGDHICHTGSLGITVHSGGPQLFLLLMVCPQGRDSCCMRGEPTCPLNHVASQGPRGHTIWGA